MARFNKIYTKKLYMADGKKKDQQDKMTRLTATATELNILKGVTSLASEINWLDSSINASLMTPGTGISTGTGTVVKYSVIKRGGIYETMIMIDLTGLRGGGTIADIIGVDGGTANCHFGQITTAINGTIWGGELQCFEAPAGGDADINVYSATEATGAQDALVTGLTETQLLDGGDMSAGSWAPLTAAPAADEYIYLTNGAVTETTYTAGRFMLSLYGV
jgi:hypothetical protein